MIEPKTGAVRFRDGATITRELTLATFDGSPLAKRSARDEDSDDTYVTIRLAPREMDGEVFGAQILFHDEVLNTVNLWIMDETAIVDGVIAYPPEKGWDTWTLKTAVAAKARHDAWLLRVLGPPTKVDAKHYITSYELPWGSAWSSYDPRGGGSEIGLRYAARDALTTKRGKRSKR